VDICFFSLVVSGMSSILTCSQSKHDIINTIKIRPAALTSAVELLTNAFYNFLCLVK